MMMLCHRQGHQAFIPPPLPSALPWFPASPPIEYYIFPFILNISSHLNIILILLKKITILLYLYLNLSTFNLMIQI